MTECGDDDAAAAVNLTRLGRWIVSLKRRGRSGELGSVFFVEREAVWFDGSPPLLYVPTKANTRAGWFCLPACLTSLTLLLGGGQEEEGGFVSPRAFLPQPHDTHPHCECRQGRVHHLDSAPPLRLFAVCLESGHVSLSALSRIYRTMSRVLVGCPVPLFKADGRCVWVVSLVWRGRRL